MRRSTAIRAAACTVLAAGLAAPLLRRRLKLKPPVVIAAAAATPFALTALVVHGRASASILCSSFDRRLAHGATVGEARRIVSASARPATRSVT